MMSRHHILLGGKVASFPGMTKKHVGDYDSDTYISAYASQGLEYSQHLQARILSEKQGVEGSKVVGVWPGVGTRPHQKLY